METIDFFNEFFVSLFNPIVKTFLLFLLAVSVFRFILTFIFCIFRASAICKINDSDVDNNVTDVDNNDIDLDNTIDKYDDYRG